LYYTRAPKAESLIKRVKRVIKNRFQQVRATTYGASV